jgi:hypothetical protein
VASALGIVLGVESEMEQGVVVRVGDHHDVAAAAAVAPAGTASRDKFLTPEGEASVAAIARFYFDLYFVDKPCRKMKKAAWV